MSNSTIFSTKQRGKLSDLVVSEVFLDITSKAWPKQDRLNKIKNFSLQDTAKSVTEKLWNERTYMQPQWYKNDNKKANKI